jgi:hypothetical protein
MDYSFLSNLTLVDTGRMRQPKEKNPTGMTVRVYANGEVYPSKELVEKYKLEYVNKESTEKANGIDVVDSTEWTPMATQPRMILFGITPKTEPKVDLFGSCKFNDDGSPKSSVMTQGAASEELLNLTRSLGFLTPEQKYVDLVLLEQYPINTKDGLAYIPKTVSRGPKKGEKDYERRENVTFYTVLTTEEFEKQKTIATKVETTQTVTI